MSQEADRTRPGTLSDKAEVQDFLRQNFKIRPVRQIQKTVIRLEDGERVKTKTVEDQPIAPHLLARYQAAGAAELTATDASDFADIALLLDNPTDSRRLLDRVTQRLREIDADLTAEQARTGVDFQSSVYGEPNRLARCIHRLGLANGWQAGQCHVYFANCDSVEDLIESKQLWRDGIGGDKAHGEFSHSIQWFMIACVKSHAAELYRKSVMYTSENFFSGKGIQGRKQITLWDFLVDCFSKIEPCRDWAHNINVNTWRSPSILDRFLRDLGDGHWLAGRIGNSPIHTKIRPAQGRETPGGRAHAIVTRRGVPKHFQAKEGCLGYESQSPGFFRAPAKCYRLLLQSP